LVGHRGTCPRRGAGRCHGLRGIEGFGSSGRLRSSRFPDAVVGLPVVVEIVDSPERIDAFVPIVLATAPDALVVLEEVDAVRRAAPERFALDDPEITGP